MANSSSHLVTGGAGFIGSHIVERLLAEGHRVRVFDNFSTGSRANLGLRPRQPSGSRSSAATCATPKAVERAVRGVTAVLPPGGDALGAALGGRPARRNAANVTGTLHVLHAAAQQKKKPRVVYASSSSVYGERPDLPKREDQPTAPISPYAATKVAGELYASVWSRLFGVETVGLRYFNVFGPRQDPKSEYAAVIPRFILWGCEGKPLQVHGDGTQSRDFTYIDNVVSANLLAARAPAAAVSGKSYNVGCGSRTSLLEIIAHARGHARPARSRASTRRRRVGDVPHTLADVSAAKRDMGYEPLVDFDEGLRRTVEFFTGRKHDDDAARTRAPGPRVALRSPSARRGGGRAERQSAWSSRSPTEPPGLDLTASPASAIAGGRLRQRPGRPDQGRPHRQAGPVAGRALVHHRQQELHVLPPQGRALPQRPRDEGGRRQVRARPRGQPRDQASLPHRSTRRSRTSSSRTTTRSASALKKRRTRPSSTRWRARAR